MARTSLSRIGVIAVVGITVFAAGAIAAWLWFVPPIPPSLAIPTPALTAPINYQKYSDSRSVTLTIDVAQADPLESSAAGRITATTCSPGSELTSGAPLISVDGRPLLALSTSIPLWRDLKEGDTGDDVTSLQSELARLGYPITPGGRLGSATLNAVAHLFTNAGDKDFDPSGIPFNRFVWLPAPSAQADSCEARVGTTLTSGDRLATLSPELTKVFVAEMPSDLAMGPRTLSLDSVTVPIGSDGVVSDPESVRLLATTPSVAQGLAPKRNTPTERSGAGDEDTTAVSSCSSSRS